MRKDVQGSLTAVVRPPEPDDDAACSRICALQLLNLSPAGLAALVEQPIELKSIVEVILPHPDTGKLVKATGHVVRCTPMTEAYQVCIDFELKPAA